jgi:mono/diheme cytochrome c family protein/plastocyanin
MRSEWLARMIVFGLLVAAIAIPLVAWWGRSTDVVVHARMAESGGWTPEHLAAEVGKPLHLHLTSDDVVHSFAIGQSDDPPVDIYPGQVTEITLIFDRPGRYTFYCTRWCGLNHWRMRGTIEVTGEAPPVETHEPALYVTLGLDIDAELHASVVPSQKPSAKRGAELEVELPNEFQSREYYLSHSPLDLWQSLRQEDGLLVLNDQEIWDLVAFTWQSQTNPFELAQGQQIYALECAACHGESGAGDGVFARQMQLSVSGEFAAHQADEMASQPTDFSDARHMLAASPARLQGKILRGGMGTGMPYYGPIYTEDEIWALVSYLWTFQFDYWSNNE